MKTLRYIFGIIFFGILGLFVVAQFFPGEYSVERSITINASAGKIFPYINNLKNWQDWTVWTKEHDETLKMNYSEKTDGVGARQLWKSEKLGNGDLLLTASEDSSFIEYNLNMENGKFLSKGKITLTAKNGTTEAQWRNYGELGVNPIFRIIAYFFIEDMIAPDFENGLKNLKRLAESEK